MNEEIRPRNNYFEDWRTALRTGEHHDKIDRIIPFGTDMKVVYKLPLVSMPSRWSEATYLIDTSIPPHDFAHGIEAHLTHVREAYMENERIQTPETTNE